MGSEVTGIINNPEEIIVYLKRRVLRIEVCDGKHADLAHQWEGTETFPLDIKQEWKLAIYTAGALPFLPLHPVEMELC